MAQGPSPLTHKTGHLLDVPWQLPYLGVASCRPPNLDIMRALSILPVLLPLCAAIAQPGSPDTGFNGDGIVKIDINGGSNDLAQDVIFQSDGKAVIAGFTGLTNQDFCLIRLLPDGSLDNSFGGDGKVTTEVNGASDRARAVTVQPDGKIIAAGHTHVGATDDIAVLRYNPDGALDNGFGINGRVIVDVDGDDRALSVVLQGDGKILAAGHSESDEHERFTLLRLLADGTPDPDFGTAGIAQAAFLPEDDATGWDAALQPDGKIVMVGHASDGTYQQFAMARFNTNGSLDAGFGTGGTVTVDLGSADDIAHSVAVQGDGKIVVAGYSSNGINEHYLAMRLLSDGTLDPAFGSGGTVETSVSGYDTPHGVVVQPDGRIVLAGYSHNGMQRVFSSVRLLEDGSLDATYDGDGKVLLPIGTVEDKCFNLALAPNGSLAMVGYSDGSNSADYTLVMVLSGLNMGVLDTGAGRSVLFAYPNPVGEQVTLAFDLPKALILDARLLDEQGRELRRWAESHVFHAGTNHLEMDMSGLPGGHYTAVLRAGEATVSVKLLKQ
jgi:uncharacterized delta-60 repeat protein